MKTLVLVLIGMTSAFLAESCQGDRTQGQQSVLKTAKSTVEVHSVWHNIYVATETGGQMRAVVCYSVRLRKLSDEAGLVYSTRHLLPGLVWLPELTPRHSP
jgi:hypothetical protein